MSQLFMILNSKLKQLLKKYRERNREKKEEKEYNEKIISYR